MKVIAKGAVRLPCASANLRRAERVITRFYEAQLRPSGVKGTQFTLLQALDTVQGISQKGLAELLEMDSTTLTRTLALLRGKGWVVSEAGADRREWRFRLTTKGQSEFRKALPYWQAAQSALKKALGTENWNRLLDSTVGIADIARSQAGFK